MMKTLKVAAAADRLDVSVCLVYSLCASGRLRHCRIGLGRGMIRIPEDAIEEYLEGCMVGAKRPAPAPAPPPLPEYKHIKIRHGSRR